MMDEGDDDDDDDGDNDDVDDEDDDDDDVDGYKQQPKVVWPSMSITNLPITTKANTNIFFNVLWRYSLIQSGTRRKVFHQHGKRRF